MLKKIKKSSSLLILSSIVFLFLIINISAQGCDSSGWKGYAKINENKTIQITCPTCTYINFSANLNQENILINQEMDKNGNTFTYTFNGDDLNKLGTVYIDGFSQLEHPLGLCFDITLTGKSNSVSSYITMIIFLIISLLLLIWLNIKFNYGTREKLYTTMVSKYFDSTIGNQKSNLAYAILYTIAYSLLKMFFIFYYIIILLILLLLNEFVIVFNIYGLMTLMSALFNIFLWGLIIVCFVFISMLYDLIVKLIKELEDKMLGVEQ